MTKPQRIVTIFLGAAGDRNRLAVPGAEMLGVLLADKLKVPLQRIGSFHGTFTGNWRIELSAALPGLRSLATALDIAMSAGDWTLTTMGRCAAGLATLPVIARHHPDAVIVWFDAHGDCNVPEHTTTGYLGGMVLSGAAGLWDSGLGSGLSLNNVILVGSRDLDPFERALVDRSAINLVGPGPFLADRLREAIGNRPVYVHLDCDVLDPGIVPTEYSVMGGLTREDLRDACRELANHVVVGIEIAEFQSEWPDGRPADCHVLASMLDSMV